MARSVKLYERVAKIVGVSNPQVTDIDIYDSLNDVQDQICQRLLCLEKSGTLAVVSGSVSVPTGFFRMKRIVMPDGTAIFPQEIDVQEFDSMQHLLFTNFANTIQYYKMWNSVITFLPTPTNGSYTFYYYGLPTTTIATAVEPEIPAYMDGCLQYGATSDALIQMGQEEKGQYWKNLYEEEMKRLLDTWRATKTVSNTILYHDL